MLVIGEKINASNKSVGKAIDEKNAGFLADLAQKEDVAGADFIDVNCGVGKNARQNAGAVMEWLMDVVQDATSKPICIDSDDPAVIKAALGKYRGEKLMINSVNAEPDRLDSIGKLAAESGTDLVALVMKEGGIPATVEERMVAAEMIMTHLNKLGVQEDKVYFDPLVLPISVDQSQGLVTLDTIQEIKRRYPAAKTTMGLSNISFGLPNRGMINRAFMLMSVAAGLDSAILDPLDAKMMSMVKISDMLVGKDSGCRKYIKAHRKGLLVE